MIHREEWCGEHPGAKEWAEKTWRETQGLTERKDHTTPLQGAIVIKDTKLDKHIIVGSPDVYEAITQATGQKEDLPHTRPPADIPYWTRKPPFQEWLINGYRPRTDTSH